MPARCFAPLVKAANLALYDKNDRIPSCPDCPKTGTLRCDACYEFYELAGRFHSFTKRLAKRYGWQRSAYFDWEEQDFTRGKQIISCGCIPQTDVHFWFGDADYRRLRISYNNMFEIKRYWQQGRALAYHDYCNWYSFYCRIVKLIALGF